MALTQADRISISKKIVDIPRQDAAADKTKETLAETKAEFTEQDTANQGLVTSQDTLINGYQDELGRYDGLERTELSEQDFQDSVNRVKNNPFFPNDPQLPLPNLPDGVWVNFIPYALTKATGKKFDESQDSIQKEQDLIDDVLAAVSAVEAFGDVTRSTGEECISGSCSLPAYNNATDCTNNGGTWNPSTSTIQSDAAMQAAGTDLINAVQAWEDFVNGTIPVIVTTDTDATRSSENTTSLNDANNVISEIDSWQALPDYATHSATDCTAFNNIDVNLLDQSKFRDDSLDIIKDELTARQAFITTRISQLEGYLGDVVQDLNDGSFTPTGFYGDRFRFIDLRLNAVGGSLTRLKGLEAGEKAQDQFKQANANAAAAYSSVLEAVAFRSPAVNSTSIHVLDASAFSPGDSVYVVSDTQAEISATIDSIDGNRVILDTPIPEKYRHTELARLYKVL